MAKQGTTRKPATTTTPTATTTPATPPHAGRPSALLDTRVFYCGDTLEQLAKLPDACVDLIYIDPPFNSDRHYEVFGGETKEKRVSKDRQVSTPRCTNDRRPAPLAQARNDVNNGYK